MIVLNWPLPIGTHLVNYPSRREIKLRKSLIMTQYLCNNRVLSAEQMDQHSSAEWVSSLVVVQRPNTWEGSVMLGSEGSKQTKI